MGSWASKCSRAKTLEWRIPRPPSQGTYPHRAIVFYLILYFCPNMEPAGQEAQSGSVASARMAWGVVLDCSGGPMKSARTPVLSG